MKRSAFGAVAAVLVVGAGVFGQERAADEVKRALGALNEAFERGDAAAVRKLMTDDHVAVTSYYGGPLTRDEQLGSLPDLKLSEYKAGEMRVTLLAREAALVTYPLTRAGTYKGRPVPRKSFASSVWVKREGKWRESFYQETPLEAR